MKSIITAIIAVALTFLVSCQQQEPEPEKAVLKKETPIKEVVVKKKVYKFPHEMDLADDEGRTISVTLIGRSIDEVIFNKQDNPQTFRYSINELSPDSIEIILSMPVTEKAVKQVEVAEKDPYIANQELKIDLLTKEVQALNQKLIEAGNDTAKKRGINSQISAIYLKIQKEKQAVIDYKHQQIK